MELPNEISRQDAALLKSHAVDGLIAYKRKYGLGAYKELQMRSGLTTNDFRTMISGGYVKFWKYQALSNALTRMEEEGLL